MIAQVSNFKQLSTAQDLVEQPVQVRADILKMGDRVLHKGRVLKVRRTFRPFDLRNGVMHVHLVSVDFQPIPGWEEIRPHDRVKLPSHVHQHEEQSLVAGDRLRCRTDEMFQVVEVAQSAQSDLEWLLEEQAAQVAPERVEEVKVSKLRPGDKVRYIRCWYWLQGTKPCVISGVRGLELDLLPVDYQALPSDPDLDEKTDWERRWQHRQRAVRNPKSYLWQRWERLAID